VIVDVKGRELSDFCFKFRISARIHINILGPEAELVRYYPHPSDCNRENGLSNKIRSKRLYQPIQPGTTLQDYWTTRRKSDIFGSGFMEFVMFICENAPHPGINMFLIFLLGSLVAVGLSGKLFVDFLQGLPRLSNFVKILNFSLSTR